MNGILILAGLLVGYFAGIALLAWASPHNAAGEIIPACWVAKAPPSPATQHPAPVGAAAREAAAPTGHHTSKRRVVESPAAATTDPTRLWAGAGDAPAHTLPAGPGYPPFPGPGGRPVQRHG